MSVDIELIKRVEEVNNSYFKLEKDIKYYPDEGLNFYNYL